jgi:hypothetical protein
MMLILIIFVKIFPRLLLWSFVVQGIWPATLLEESMYKAKLAASSSCELQACKISPIL